MQSGCSWCGMRNHEVEECQILNYDDKNYHRITNTKKANPQRNGNWNGKGTKTK